LQSHSFLVFLLEREKCIGYRGFDSTEPRGPKQLAKLRRRKGAEAHCDVSLKWLAVPVSAEMLNSKLLSTQAAGLKDLYFTLCDGNTQGPDMAEL
jgi:hypothetical protein